MKIIYPEYQSDITADSFDPNFPAENLLNDIPSKIWKARSGVSSTTIGFIIGAGANAVSIFNTNAVSATITVKDGLGATVKSTTFTLSGGTRTYNRAWMEYTLQATVHSATITLTATTGVTVYAGIVRAGKAVDLPNPQYGLGESRVDHSVVMEMNDGSLYIRKKAINRTFNLSFIVARGTEYYDFCDVYDVVGPEPLAMLIADGITDSQWCVFGHMLQPFSSGHDYYNHSTFSVPITEAI